MRLPYILMILALSLGVASCVEPELESSDDVEWSDLRYTKDYSDDLPCEKHPLGCPNRGFVGHGIGTFNR